MRARPFFLLKGVEACRIFFRFIFLSAPGWDISRESEQACSVRSTESRVDAEGYGLGLPTGSGWLSWLACWQPSGTYGLQQALGTNSESHRPAHVGGHTVERGASGRWWPLRPPLPLLALTN